MNDEPYPPTFSFVNPEWEAIRQTVNCPTCNGNPWAYAPRDCDGIPAHHCPDCTDGKIPMARLFAVGAAVFNMPLASGGNPYDPDDTSFIYADGYNTAFAELRAVQP